MKTTGLAAGATGCWACCCLRVAISCWRVATRADSLAMVGLLAADIALVETGMVENGLGY